LNTFSSEDNVILAALPAGQPAGHFESRHMNRGAMHARTDVAVQRAMMGGDPDHLTGITVRA
jgi:hypothetical protein